jgi:hypothetical protein
MQQRFAGFHGFTQLNGCPFEKPESTRSNDATGMIARFRLLIRWPVDCHVQTARGSFQLILQIFNFLLDHDHSPAI